MKNEMLPLPTNLTSYMNEITKYPLLSQEEEFRLAEIIVNGSDAESAQAKETFLVSNLRLVVSIANKYHYQNIDLMDLIQEGNIGLMTALDKFEYEKGFKFSTYATWWIRQSITRFITNFDSAIRIPVHLNESLVKYHAIQKKFLIEYGREATDNEMVKMMNVDIYKIEYIKKYSYYMTSLNSPIKSEDSEEEIGNFIASEYPSPEEDIIRKISNYQVRVLIEKSNLTEKEKFVIKKRFGFEDGEVKTLQAISEELGVTRERIRQIEACALHKLKVSKKFDDLYQLA